jgi:hypothetical protein
MADHALTVLLVCALVAAAFYYFVGAFEDLAAQVACCGIVPERLVGGAHERSARFIGARQQARRVRSNAPARRTRLAAVGLASQR